MHGCLQDGRLQYQHNVKFSRKWPARCTFTCYEFLSRLVRALRWASYEPHNSNRTLLISKWFQRQHYWVNINQYESRIQWLGANMRWRRFASGEQKAGKVVHFFDLSVKVKLEVRLRPPFLLLMEQYVTYNMSASAPICEAITIPMCRYMPFNYTRMPNLMQHTSQNEARSYIDQYDILVHTRCSADLLFFLCSVFAPMCMTASAPGNQDLDLIPPCRHVCESARKGCEPLMKHFGAPWPFECSRLPLYEKAMCTSPEAFMITGTTKVAGTAHVNTCKSATGSKLHFHDCNCKKQSPLKAKIYKKLRFDYAIRAKVLAVDTKGDVTIANVSVVRIFKQNLVRFSKGNILYLWTICSCTCPKLQANQNYVILGHEDVQHQMLLYNHASIAKKWKQSLGEKIKKWVLMEKPDKKRRRQRDLMDKSLLLGHPVNRINS